MALIVRSARATPWWRDLDPARPVQLLWCQRWLLYQLVGRELKARYRGSLLGSLWTVLLPVLAVVIYSLVFGFILKSKWPGHEGGGWSFALLLFAGLALFNAFAEVLQRAPGAILVQPNLVKKVVFPLEILPATLLGTALVPLLLAGVVVFEGLYLAGSPIRLHWVLFAVVPFLIWLQGLAWFLSGVGTFLRDLGPMVAALCPLMMFLSPLFYPVSLVPEPYQWWMWVNPLAVAVEAVRAGFSAAAVPPLGACIWYMACSLATWQFGYWTFARLRPEMADVV